MVNRRSTLTMLSVLVLVVMLTGCDKQKNYFEQQAAEYEYNTRVDDGREDDGKSDTPTGDTLDARNPIPLDEDSTWAKGADEYDTLSEAVLRRKARQELAFEAEQGHLDGMKDGASDAAADQPFGYHYTSNESFEYIKAYEEAYVRAYANGYETMIGAKKKK